jgi:hypothetical protein
MSFGPSNCTMKIRKSIWDSNSQHGSSLVSVKVHSLTLFALSGACDVTPGSFSWPATLQPPWLDYEPKVRVVIIRWRLQLSNIVVTTLTLGSQPRQGLARLWAKKETKNSHLMLPWMQKSVKEWTLTPPSELPFWELESQIFREKLQGSKLIGLRHSLYHWKYIRT